MVPPIIFSFRGGSASGGKNKYLISAFAISGLILVIAFSNYYIHLADKGGLLVIHFDSYRGADFFGNNTDVADILVFSGIILLLNCWLANTFYFRERLLSYLITFITLSFSVLILIAINVIISVN